MSGLWEIMDESSVVELKCNECRDGGVKAKLTTELREEPQFLLVHLKRYESVDGVIQKDDAPVDIRQVLKKGDRD